jgi:hypothetical protein
LHAWDSHDWLVQEDWERLVGRAAALRALNASGPPEVTAIERIASALRGAAAAAGYRVDRLLRPAPRAPAI